MRSLDACEITTIGNIISSLFFDVTCNSNLDRIDEWQKPLYGNNLNQKQTLYEQMEMAPASSNCRKSLLHAKLKAIQLLLFYSFIYIDNEAIDMLQIDLDGYLHLLDAF